MLTRRRGDAPVLPDEWLTSAPMTPGSWWPAWHEWLLAHASDAPEAPPPPMGTPPFAALADAPGTYVMEK